MCEHACRRVGGVCPVIVIVVKLLERQHAERGSVEALPSLKDTHTHTHTHTHSHSLTHTLSPSCQHTNESSRQFPTLEHPTEGREALVDVCCLNKAGACKAKVKEGNSEKEVLTCQRVEPAQGIRRWVNGHSRQPRCNRKSEMEQVQVCKNHQRKDKRRQGYLAPGSWTRVLSQQGRTA